MIDWLLKYWLQVLFGAALAVLGRAYKALQGRVQKWGVKQDAVAGGIQALLRDRIIQAHTHYMQRGELPLYARENIEKMYSEYKTLGGNGAIERIKLELDELPTIKEDEN